jgi:hypothetical protein
MEWLCSCGNQVTTVELLWKWRDASAIGQQHGRHVCYGCRIGCKDCVHEHGDKDYQYFKVRLTARTKRDLVGQIVAEVIKQGPLDYLPRTDLQKALRSVRKRT